MTTNEKKKYLKKLNFLIRWVFQDLLINIESYKNIWSNYNKNGFSSGKIKIVDSRIILNESNMGSLQLLCVGVELFGRVINGFGIKKKKSGKAFKLFMERFKNSRYRSLKSDLYKCYRCGLLHSYILGYDDKEVGFFPVRGTLDHHLMFTTRNGKQPKLEKSSRNFRLAVDIDQFYKDFKEAVECLIFDFKNNNLSELEYKNIKKSIYNIPQD
ncbi:MAG: hypothetical protein ABH837_01900 [bacterium]